MKSESSGRVVPKTCKSWLCPDCNVWLRQGARGYLIEGAAATLVGGEHPGLQLGFLTLTDKSRAELDFGALHQRWSSLAKALRRRGWMAGYAQTVELQQRGALHPHAIVRVPDDLVPFLREGGSERRNKRQYRWHFSELVPLVQAHGFGQMCDFAVVSGGNFNETVGYAVKSLSRYATKQSAAQLKAAGATRLRPVRASTDWVPGKGLRDFQRGEGVDAGPWVDVSSVCGRLAG